MREISRKKKETAKSGLLKWAAVLLVMGLLSAKVLPVQAAPEEKVLSGQEAADGKEDSAETEKEETFLAGSGTGYATNLEGTLGTNGGLKWSYEEETETLTVSGEDELICFYSITKSPFQVKANFTIKKIVFKNCKITGNGTVFINLRDLEEIDFSGLDTSEMTNIIFTQCSSLTSVNLSGCDTSAVTDMSYMFSKCSSLTSLDMSGCDTSAVTDMGSMFSGCSSLTSLDLSGWDTRAVTDMGWMFSLCRSLTSLDMSGWDTRAVTDMSYMFNGCSGLTSLGIRGWDTRAVTGMSYMFNCCSSLTSLDMRGWDTRAVTNMEYMFYGCSSLTGLDMSGWDTRAVTNMEGMFSDCSNLTRLDLSSWDTSAVANMSSMFCNCSKLINLDISGFDVSRSSVDQFFYNCDNLILLKTPKKMGDKLIDLPCKMKDGRGVWYSYLSNSGVQKTLTREGHEHTYDSETITKVATCKDEGIKTCTCNVCWYINEEPIEKEPHTYDSGTITKAATCKDEGIKTYTCSVCLDTKTEPVEKLTEHTYDEGKVTRRATCITEGVKTYTCIVCEKTKTESIEKSKEHTYDSGKVTKQPTRETEGEMLYTCINCGKTKTEIIEKKISNIKGTFGTKGKLNWDYEEDMFILTVSGEDELICDYDYDPYNTLRSPFQIKSDFTIKKIIFKNCKITGGGALFVNLKNLEEIDFSGLNTSAITNMSGMFKGCSSLTSLDLSGFDTSAVTDMSYMFSQCSNLDSLDLSGLDMSAVTSVAYVDEMLSGCTKLFMLKTAKRMNDSVKLPYVMYDDKQGESYYSMASRNTGMTLYKYRHTPTIHVYDEGKVTKEPTEDIEGEKIYTCIICGATKAELLEPKNGTKGVIGSEKQLKWSYDKDTFTLTVSGEDELICDCNVDSYPSYQSPFQVKPDFIIKKIIFKNCKITGRGALFANLKFLEKIDFSGLDTSAMTNMKGMFWGCLRLSSLDVSSFDTSAVTNMYSMFCNCACLTSLDLSSFNTSDVKNMYGMFKGCSSLTSLDLSGWDTSKVWNLAEMFSGCRSLTSLDLSNFDTYGAEDLTYMFSGCRSLTSLDLSNFDTYEVEDMYGMFYNCSSLTSLDLSSFNTSDVWSLSSMFSGCSSLTSLDLSSWDTSEVQYMSSMFSGCNSLALLKTPKFVGKASAELPHVMYDEEGNSYEIMSNQNAGKILVNENNHTDTNHSYDSGKITKEATCKAEGVMTYTCVVCGKTKTEAIAKLPHTYQNKLTKATLSKDGKITPTCTACGATKTATVISRPKTITLSASSFSYNGKAKKPAVTVKDAAGKTIKASNYTVTYASGRTKVGSYQVKVAFKGNYSGTKALSFTINPAPVKIKSVKAASKKLTVKWEKNTKEVTGYELQYCTNKNFPKASTKTVTIKKNSTTSNTISKLKAKTKYFVRIRTYKTVSGKKYYSGWSKSGNAVTKK